MFKIVLNKTGKNQRNPPVLADFFNFIKERKAQLWFLPVDMSLLRLFTPRDNLDSIIPSFKSMGITPFLKYTTASVFVHSLALLSIEFFSFTSIWLLLLRVISCTLLTLTCILAVEGIRR